MRSGLLAPDGMPGSSACQWALVRLYRCCLLGSTRTVWLSWIGVLSFLSLSPCSFTWRLNDHGGPPIALGVGDSRSCHGELPSWLARRLAVPRQGRVAKRASVSVLMPGADDRRSVLSLRGFTGSQIITLDGVDTVRRACGQVTRRRPVQHHPNMSNPRRVPPPDMSRGSRRCPSPRPCMSFYRIGTSFRANQGPNSSEIIGYEGVTQPPEMHHPTI